MIALGVCAARTYEGRLQRQSEVGLVAVAVARDHDVLVFGRRRLRFALRRLRVDVCRAEATR